MSVSRERRDLDAAARGLTNHQALVLRIAYLAVTRTGRYPEHDILKAMVDLDSHAFFRATYGLRKSGLLAWREGMAGSRDAGPHGLTRKGALVAAELSSD